MNNLKGLNIVIGPNNCGKTHILNALNELNNIDKTSFSWTIQEAKRFLRRDEPKIESHFEGLPSQLILKQNSQTNLEEISDKLGSFGSKKFKEKITNKPVLFCPDERLGQYKDSNFNEFISENFPDLPGELMDEVESNLSKTDPKLDTTVLPRKGKGETRLQRIIEKVGLPYEINEQGSGIRSLICLMVDILSSEKDVVLVDEPELGLNPAAKQNLLKWFLKLSKEEGKQVFVATHDPTFIHPLIVKGEDVNIFLYSSIDDKFKIVDLSETAPELFAGFMPHTSSLKELHFYVEGPTDVHAIQAMLQKFLRSRGSYRDGWYQIFNRIGLYHLGGDKWSHFLYTIPITPKSIVILDGNKETDFNEKIEEINRYGNKMYPKFEPCENIDELRDILSKEGVCPVYFLDKKDMKGYFSVEKKSVKVIADAAWNTSVEDLPKEFTGIFESALSIFSKTKKEYTVFYEKFKEFTGWKNYGKGVVRHTDEIAFEGKYSLKKTKSSDPDGGYKLLPEKVGLDTLFSGWVYRPSNYNGGPSDRLSIEDEKFNGYGFVVQHERNYISIERRDDGKGKNLTGERRCRIPVDRWYRFKFYLKEGGKISLYLYDDSGNKICKIEDVLELSYSSFDRIAIRGGYEYYVDCLRVDNIN